MLLHLDFTELQRYKGMVKWWFFIILVTFSSKFGHFAFEIEGKIYEIIKLELKG